MRLLAFTGMVLVLMGQSLGAGSLGSGATGSGSLGSGATGGSVAQQTGCSLGDPYALWYADSVSGADLDDVTTVANEGTGPASFDLVSTAGKYPQLRTAGNCTGGSGKCLLFASGDYLSMAANVANSSSARVICMEGHFPASAGGTYYPMAWRSAFSAHTFRMTTAQAGSLYVASAGTPAFTVPVGWHSVCMDLTTTTAIKVAIDGVDQTDVVSSGSIGAWNFTFNGYDNGTGSYYAGLELGRAALYTSDPGLTVAELSSCGARLFAEASPSRTSTPAAFASRYFGVNGTESRVHGSSITAYESSVESEFDFDYSDSATTQLQTVGASYMSPTTTGDYALTMDLNGAGGTQVPSYHSSTIAAASSFTALLVGDSLTAGQTYPSRANSVTTGKGTYVGTQGTGTLHEGHGGKHWQWFATNAASPMTTAGGVLDLPTYIASLSSTPTHVVWLLGTNNVFTQPLATIATMVTSELDHAETIIDAWPGSGVVHAFALTLPGLADDSGFAAYSGEGLSWWVWRQKQQAMVLGILGRFGGREAEDIYIIPTNASVSGSLAVGDYSSGDGIHPNTQGYQRLGDTVGAFLLWQNRT